ALAHAKATAKACTAARSETFGSDHRVPEAARAVAWAAGAKDNAHIWDALTAVEEELLARIALVAEYHRQPERRRAIVDGLRTPLAPVAQPTGVSSEPVPSSPRESFSVGQRLVHATFGTVEVIAAGPSTIEVRL